MFPHTLHTMAARSDDLTLEITRVISAAGSIVFGAFQDADELSKWWGPKGFTIPSLEFEPSPGDTYRIKMQPPEGDAFYLTGEFKAVDPPTRLAMSFVWEDPDPDDVETSVELSFRELAGSTEVLLIQGVFKTEARRELHRSGWTDAFDKLERLVAQR
jgi:uncharacterized protein YndB with AHSA1/START domain